jgi:hypothetical protein
MDIAHGTISANPDETPVTPAALFIPRPSHTFAIHSSGVHSSNGVNHSGHSRCLLDDVGKSLSGGTCPKE